MLPPTRIPLTKTERRDLKRRLGRITDEIAAIVDDLERLAERKDALEGERERILAQVYRS